MFFFDTIAVLGVFTLIAATVSFTLGSTVYLMNSMVKGYFAYLQNELELRRFEAETRTEQARLQHSIPVWVDRTDPMEVAAWNRAVAETWRISASSSMQRLTS